MPVKVSEVEDDEMLRAFTISSVAFQRNESVWDAMYPKHWQDSGRKAAAKRWIAQKKTNPHTLFAKAVDETTGTIIGVAVWFIYHPSILAPANGTIQGEEADYEDDDDVAWCKEIIAEFARWREGSVFITNRLLVDLECLAVDPAWQKHGAGDALVKFGCQKADELGVTGVVGSTAAGKRVYEKNGYMDVSGPAGLRVSEQFSDRQVQHLTWMMRPRRAK